VRRGGVRSLAVTSVLIVGSLLAAVVASEIAYRFARRFVCIASPPALFAVRSWGWMHRANLAVEAHFCVGRTFEWRTLVTTNSHGLHDREIPYEKPAGTTRVVLLGDSISEAIQVPLAGTFAKLVEARLQAGGRVVEVVNGGHAGYGTDSEIFFYRDEGRRYQPDLVVLAFNFQNDVIENLERLYRRSNETVGVRWAPKTFFELADDGALREVPIVPEPGVTKPVAVAEPVPAWRRWLGEHLYLARLVERIETPPPSVRTEPVRPVIFESYAPWTEEWDDAWRITTRLVAELRREVEQDGARFAVVLVPTKEMADAVALQAAVGWFRLPVETYDLDRQRRAMVAFLGRRARVSRPHAGAAEPRLFTWTSIECTAMRRHPAHGRFITRELARR
jgi:hypothetical protein